MSGNGALLGAEEPHNVGALPVLQLGGVSRCLLLLDEVTAEGASGSPFNG